MLPAGCKSPLLLGLDLSPISLCYWDNLDTYGTFLNKVFLTI